jgi:hypothetical protein
MELRVFPLPISRATRSSLRRSAGPLSSGILTGGGAERSAQLLDERVLVASLFRQRLLYRWLELDYLYISPMTMASAAASPAKCAFLRRR